ncbi:MATE family efflux transporter [uncultured Tenacibaculum sp.]|uniref:lipopolysaccharide biosynthesis protein n=1 Tax=uncultured Tenacibaculum sp. TaxID=174713 RepID=UPI0026325FC2|nr:MATE family efflux transporter [uncultured Tenacibaculum sp.]
MKIFERLGNRNKFVLKSFSASFVARVVGLLFTIIATPFLLKELGEEEYGIWSILISLSGYLAFSDLGLGNGLLNFLLQNKEDVSLVKKSIKTTFLFLSIVSTLLILIFGIFTLVFDWETFFSIKKEDLNLVFFLVITVFCLNIPLAIIQKVQYAFLDNPIYHFWEAIQKILSMVLILVLIYFKKGLIWYVLAFYLPVNIVNIFNIITYQRKNNLIKVLFEKPLFDKKVFQIIFKTGSLFFLMNLTYLFGRSVDKFLLARVGNLELVTSYDILMRPYEIMIVFVMMLSSSLWSAFGEALQKKDYNWITNILKKGTKLSFILITIFTLILTFLGNYILSIWLGNNYSFSRLYYILLGVWTLFLLVSNILSSFLNAANILKFQIKMFVCYGIVSFIFKYLGINYYDLLGFIIGNIIAFGICILLPSYLKINNFIYDKNN